MKFFSANSLSLRNRFRFTMAMVFLPIVVVAVGSSMFLNHAGNTLNQIVEQPIHKLQTTTQLQNQIRNGHALVKDYATTPRFALKSQFETEARRVDNLLTQMRQTNIFDPTEQTLLATVHRDWSDGLVLANVIFSSDDHKAASIQLEQRVNQMMFTLDQLYTNYYEDIQRQRTGLNESEHRYLLIISVSVGIGLILAIVGAIWLARSVLIPLREFEKGVAHFSKEDLSYRLNLNNQDELGHLAVEFNTMAERLLAHRQKLEELSVRDGLTGLYNRRELEKRLQEEVHRARRYQHPISVMMLDIDHFKSVNDRYGHRAGDEVLITVADLIQLHIRPVDVACRYGGEELAVIFPETDQTGARTVAERIRSTIEDSVTTTPEGDMIHVTVSIGLGQFPVHGDSATALLHAADQALYAAKHEGRNLVRSR